MTGGDDDWNIGTRSDLSQHVQPIRLAKLQIEDHHPRLFRGKPSQRLLWLGNGGHPHVVPFQIVHHHALQSGVIVDKQDARWLVDVAGNFPVIAI